MSVLMDLGKSKKKTKKLEEVADDETEVETEEEEVEKEDDDDDESAVAKLKKKKKKAKKKKKKKDEDDAPWEDGDDEPKAKGGIRLSGKARSTVERTGEDPEETEEAVDVVDTDQAHMFGRAGFGAERTINLGDMQFVKFRVWLELPVAPDQDLDEVHEAQVGWVDARLESLVEKIGGEDD